MWPSRVGACGPCAFHVVQWQHTLEGQQETLANFWHLLKVGGIYVIEDMTYHPLDEWGTHPFVNAPERLTPTVRRIILNNNAFFVMSNVGNPQMHQTVF